jgi:hypothetical protein
MKNCRRKKTPNALAAPGITMTSSVSSQLSVSTMRKFGMISVAGGTNSVATISANIRPRPRKRIRANAYAAIDAVTSTTATWKTAASMLLRNQRSTGFCEPAANSTS